MAKCDVDGPVAPAALSAVSGSGGWGQLPVGEDQGIRDTKCSVIIHPVWCLLVWTHPLVTFILLVTEITVIMA